MKIDLIDGTVLTGTALYIQDSGKCTLFNEQSSNYAFRLEEIAEINNKHMLAHVSVEA